MQVRALVFVAMVGSLRQDCFTRAIANTLDELAPDDVQVDLLPSVGGIPHYSDDILSARLPEEVIAMSGAIARADAVVVVTPEYHRSVPGSLKNALDWLGTSPQRPFTGKPVAIQAASPGMLGGVRALDHLRQSLVSIEAVVLDKPEIAIPHVASKVDEPAGILRDQQTRRNISRQLEALAQLCCAEQRRLKASTPRVESTLEQVVASQPRES